MKHLIIAALLLFYVLEAQAITWDFNEDRNAQGWVAQEGEGSTTVLNPKLDSEVHDGIWRIKVIPFQEGRNPAVELISPIVDYDSALFDRVVIRLRVVHTKPITSSFGVRWTNPLNAAYPGSDPAYLEAGGCTPNPGCISRFIKVIPPLLYTTDWQEVVVSDLRSGPAVSYGTKYNILWEGKQPFQGACATFFRWAIKRAVATWGF